MVLLLLTLHSFRFHDSVAYPILKQHSFEWCAISTNYLKTWAWILKGQLARYDLWISAFAYSKGRPLHVTKETSYVWMTILLESWTTCCTSFDAAWVTHVFTALCVQGMACSAGHSLAVTHAYAWYMPCNMHGTSHGACLFTRCWYIQPPRWWCISCTLLSGSACCARHLHTLCMCSTCLTFAAHAAHEQHMH